MNSQNWAENDIDQGINYLADHETEATTETILTTDREIKILLPSGLPAYGTNITGIFMMAPILLFIVILVLFPIQILWSAGLSTTTGILSLLCIALAWGLKKVLQLMLKNRDLFPRCYFVTLGNNGIAMHFSRLHFPFHPSKMAVLWKDIQRVKRIRNLFLPGLFVGNPWATAIEVVSSNGKKIFIPFHLPQEKENAIAEKIESLIYKKLKK